MTREEAIEELKILKEDYWDDDGYGHETKQYDDAMLALDMAIKALEQEPCDAISREKALAPYEDLNDNDVVCVWTIRNNIKELPPVTPSRCKGHWIKHEGYNNDRWCTQYECSVCHEWSDDNTEYCPRCGAEMVEPQEGEE